MSNTQFMGPLMVPSDEPKSVNIDKISTALHIYYLNLIVNYLNTVQIAQIQAYNIRMHSLFRRHKWSHESGVRQVALSRLSHQKKLYPGYLFSDQWGKLLTCVHI